jgi:hypothetical protein
MATDKASIELAHALRRHLKGVVSSLDKWLAVYDPDFARSKERVPDTDFGMVQTCQVGG